MIGKQGRTKLFGSSISCFMIIKINEYLVKKENKIAFIALYNEN